MGDRAAIVVVRHVISPRSSTPELDRSIIAPRVINVTGSGLLISDVRERRLPAFVLRCQYLLLYAVRMRLTWPLVGREREMRLIEAALFGSHSTGVVITGPAGVGKSRVAAEALDAAAARGCAVRRVVGTSAGRGLPLGAMAAWADPAGSQALQLVCEVIEALTATATATATARPRSSSGSTTCTSSTTCRSS